jgi:hypothetical protein
MFKLSWRFRLSFIICTEISVWKNRAVVDSLTRIWSLISQWKPSFDFLASMQCWKGRMHKCKIVAQTFKQWRLGVVLHLRRSANNFVAIWKFQSDRVCTMHILKLKFIFHCLYPMLDNVKIGRI